MFRQLFGNAKHGGAASHFGPYLNWLNPACAPKRDQVINKVGAFADYAAAAMADRLDGNLTRLLHHLLGHLGKAVRKKTRGAGIRLRRDQIERCVQTGNLVGTGARGVWIQLTLANEADLLNIAEGRTRKRRDRTNSADSIHDFLSKLIKVHDPSLEGGPDG